MKPLPVAVAIVLTIVVGAYLYAVTRPLPPPWSPPATCRSDGDCPYPETCTVATGVCQDVALPGLLAAAQAAAQRLWDAMQSVLSNFKTSYGPHAEAFINWGYGTVSAPCPTSAIQAVVATLLPAAGTCSTSTFDSPSPAAMQATMAPLLADLAAGVANINKFIQQVLAVPGCNPAKSTSCGYWSEIMALTPSSPPALIWSTGRQGQSVLTELPTVTQAFPPVLSDLRNLLNNSKMKDLLPASSYASLVADFAISTDITQIGGYEGVLTSLASEVARTGFALYDHFMGG